MTVDISVEDAKSRFRWHDYCSWITYPAGLALVEVQVLAGGPNGRNTVSCMIICAVRLHGSKWTKSALKKRRSRRIRYRSNFIGLRRASGLDHVPCGRSAWKSR